MPEGDTVHQLADFLGTALGGRMLARVWIRGQIRPDLSGQRVRGVASTGKHLYVELEGGVCLRSHLGLYGSWHRYRPRQTWQRPERQAALVFETDDWIFVCFNAKEVEVLSDLGFELRDQRGRLGPDLTREIPGAERLRARALTLIPPEAPVVDVLLDQRVACGIGNVYKSEVLFIARRSPLLSLGDLTPEDFAELYLTAARLLRCNLGGGPRITRPIADGRGPLWVYGRRGLPCLVCGAPVRRGRLGRNPRSTYWCPVCQVSSAGASSTGLGCSPSLAQGTGP
jgi:endonuclease VIII